MKKRIWRKIKQAGLAVLLAGFIMASGEQEIFARLPVTEQENPVERSVKWEKNPEGLWKLEREAHTQRGRETAEEEPSEDENGNNVQAVAGQSEENLFVQETVEEEPPEEENGNNVQNGMGQSEENLSGQENVEEEPSEDENGNNVQVGAGQPEENLSGQEIVDEGATGGNSGNDTQFGTETEDLDGEAENGESTIPEEEEKPEEKPGTGTEENPEAGEDTENPDAEPEAGENTEKPEEETADFILTAEVNPETARAGETLVCEITAENTGTLPLENLSFFCEQLDSTLKAVLENQQGEELSWENTGMLLPGERRSFFICISVPEDRTEAVNFELTARAQPQNTVKEEVDLGDFSAEEAPETTPDEISRTVTVNTEIEALKADFQVTKTADRTAAVPGDRVLFQICIRNTGERILHSVLTTEKFQTENIPVRFLEKEGVLLDSTGTKALVSQLLPGQTVSLQAEIVIPEEIKTSKLINEVEVVTKETGEKAVTSSAEVQIHKLVQAEQEESKGMEPPSEKSYPASTRPKTGDETGGILWCVILLGAFGAVSLSCYGLLRWR